MISYIPVAPSQQEYMVILKRINLNVRQIINISANSFFRRYLQLQVFKVPYTVIESVIPTQ